MRNVKVKSDGFVWLLIPKNDAEIMFINGIDEIYKVYSDDSESLCTDLSDFKEGDYEYGLPVSSVSEIIDEFNKL